MISFEKPTVENILSQVHTGLGLDISKNHTGVCLYERGTISTYGFSIDYNKEDPYSEYRMRLDLRVKLEKILQGKHLDIIVVEDVYAGENFDTVRKLLALNTVIDELIVTGVVSCTTFLRLNEPQWLKHFRKIYKTKVRLKSKEETQEILSYLEFPFYIQNKSLTSTKKKDIFFEDICDATAMLIGGVLSLSIETKPHKIKLSNIKLEYLEHIGDTCFSKDKRIAKADPIKVDLDYNNIEDSILELVANNKANVLYGVLPTNKLGVFGLKHNFTFYESEEPVLIFYLKQKLKL